jgi:hypothetical protein
VTYSRHSIDTINVPDDGHMDGWNIYRIETHVHEKELCVKLVIYKEWKISLTFQLREWNSWTGL